MFRFKFYSPILCFVLLTTLNSHLFAHWEASRPDSHAPIGVMGDHTHKSKEWMLSYRTMTMRMNGNRSGTSDVSDAKVLQQFMVAPKKMDMEMHMLGGMWAPTDRWTLMTMFPFVRKSMDHVNRMGRTFTTEADGLGDIRVTGLFVVKEFGKQRVHLNAGVSLPTGSIDKRDDTLMPDQQLPYPMQLGSGTYDLLPGLTYLGQTEQWSWGSQVAGTFRLGENDRDYTLGDKIQTDLWGALNVCDGFSASVRLRGESWGDIDGFDKDLNPAMVPTADTKRRAGDKIDFLVGFNIFGRKSWVKGHRLAVEFGWPLYQRLDGPQLETDLTTIFGWQKAF